MSATQSTNCEIYTNYKPGKGTIMLIRRGSHSTYFCKTLGIGITIWRRGAISLLAPIGDGVPIQIVFGDWWQAHPDARNHEPPAGGSITISNVCLNHNTADPTGAWGRTNG